MAEIGKGFEFKQCMTLVKSTGHKAGNLRELREVLSRVSEHSIFHHTYQYFLKGHVLEYTNDFAQWVGESLEERALAEHLSNIDPYSFMSIADLRKELLRITGDYLNVFPEPRGAMPGGEFFFNETKTLTFQAGVRARNLAEFMLGIKYVDIGSIYYHFYEARVRLGNGVDDFSSWIENTLEKKELAASIRAIDPYMHGIEGIREHIVAEVEKEVKKDMEAI